MCAKNYEKVLRADQVITTNTVCSFCGPPCIDVKWRRWTSMTLGQWHWQKTELFFTYLLGLLLVSACTWYWTDYVFSWCPFVLNALVCCVRVYVRARLDRIEVGAVENLYRPQFLTDLHQIWKVQINVALNVPFIAKTDLISACARQSTSGITKIFSFVNDKRRNFSPIFTKFGTLIG